MEASHYNAQVHAGTQTTAKIARPRRHHSTRWMEGMESATPQFSAHPMISKAAYAPQRDKQHYTAVSQDSLHDDKKSKQEILRLLSVRNVFWQYGMARHLSQDGNSRRRIQCLDSDGLELLNHILDVARVTTLEELFLRSLTGEDISLLVRATESGPPLSTLATNKNNSHDACTI